LVEEKIAIVTDEISQDLDTVAKFLHEHDLHAIEIRSAGGSRVPDLDDRLWKDFRMRVLNEGWNVLALSPGIFKCHYSDEKRIGVELEEVLPETIGKAIEIGADYIIAFAFLGDPSEEPPDHVLGAIARAAELCHAADIKLLIENEPGSFADTGERTRNIMDSLKTENVFVNWDPCNAGILGESAKLGDSVKSIGPYIKHVHVKDGCPVPHNLYPRYGPIAEGHLGWRDHLLVLKEMGYDGWFSIETHYEPLYESSATILKELRSLLAEVDFRGVN